MDQYLVELIGEQPVTNLLSIRYLQPKEVLFVGTRQWHDNIRYLQELIGGEIPISLTEINYPYEPGLVHQTIIKKLKKLNWPLSEIIFNLSGGTRLMAFAAYHAAWDLGAPLLDLEYINGRYHARHYEFRADFYENTTDVPLPPLLTIADYLQAHLPSYRVDGFSRDLGGRIDAGGQFEEILYHTLEPHVDEILPGVRPGGVGEQIEIDLVVRIGNSIGLVEAKTGANKAGIDQLDTAGNPHFLGAHAVKFLVTGRYLSRAQKSLAYSQQVEVIELPEYRVGYQLTQKDQHNLITRIGAKLR